MSINQNHYCITAYKIKMKSIDPTTDFKIPMGSNKVFQATDGDNCMIIVTDDILNIIDQLPREKIDSVDNLGPAVYLVTAGDEAKS